MSRKKVRGGASGRGFARCCSEAPDLPDNWNGNYMAEGNGVFCGPASFVTLADDQWLAAGYAISQDDCGHTGHTNALISPRPRPATRTCRRSRRTGPGPVR